MRRGLLIVVALFSLSVLAVSGASNQSKTVGLDEEWSSGLRLTFQPYSGVGHEAMPVEVLEFDVAVGHDTNLWVREWRLRNRSGKTILKIRPALFVFCESEPDKLLLRYEPRPYFGLQLGPNEEWPKAPCLPAAKSCRNAFAVTAARKWLMPLAENGTLEGKYRIALGIDKVWFEDGTIWEFEAMKDRRAIERSDNKR